LALEAGEEQREAPRSGRGRPPTPFAKVMNSIWYRLCTGCQWKAIPESEQLCNGTTAHRWFRRLVAARVFEVVHAVLVALYVEHGVRKLRALGIDCTLVPAPLGGAATGPNPTDRGKPGVKISIVVDQHGWPLAIHLDKVNRHDIRLLGPTLAKLALEVLQRLGVNPELVADKGYDDEHARAQAPAQGCRPCLLPQGKKYGKAPKRHRWLRAVTERTHAWLKAFRAIRVCWARYRDSFQAHLLLAASAILMRCASASLPGADDVAGCPQLTPLLGIPLIVMAAYARPQAPQPVPGPRACPRRCFTPSQPRFHLAKAS